MAELDRLIAANETHAHTHTAVGHARPSRGLAVVTCMDARIDVLAVLGLDLGDAHIIRNAGGRVTDDVLRSLALSVHVLGIETVVLMQHTGCGLEDVTDEELRTRTGADIEFFPIVDHIEALMRDVEVLTNTTYLHPIEVIGGFVYDIASGRLQDVVRRKRN